MDPVRNPAVCDCSITKNAIYRIRLIYRPQCVLLHQTKRAKSVACEKRSVACKKRIVACKKGSVVCKKRIVACKKRSVACKKRASV
jgi:hypothetical protein